MKLRKLTALFLCLSMLCGMLAMNVTSVAATGKNRVKNGDFEDGTTAGWASYESTEVSAAAAHSGNYGANLTGAGNWNSLLTQTIPVSGGRTYIISFWIKTVSVGVNIQIKKNNNNGGAFATKWFTDKEWTQLTWTVTPEDTTSAIFLNFCGGGTGTTETVYVDDVSVVEVSLTEDGGFENGTADGWNLNKTTAVAAEAAYAGNYGLHLVGEGNWNSIASHTFEVTPGNDYELSFYIKANQSGVNVQIKDEATGDELATGWCDDTQWTLLTYTVTAANDTILINFCGSGTGVVEDVYLDDITLSEIAVASDDGFIKNGNFESGTAINWELFQETAISSAAAFTGNYGMVLQGDGGWGSTLVQSFPTVVGREYTVSFFIQAVQQGTNVQIKNANSAILTSGWFNNTVWQRQALTFVATTTTSTLTFCGGGTGSLEIVYVDDVSVTEILPPEPEEVIGGGKTSIRDTAFGTKALAFRFEVAAVGVKTENTTEFVADSATVKPWKNEDDVYALKSVGAIVSIDPRVDADTMELYDVDGKKVKNVPAKYLCDIAEESFAFAVRIVDIPDSEVDTSISVRPYYVYEDADGKTVVMYGDVVAATYNGTLTE